MRRWRVWGICRAGALPPALLAVLPLLLGALTLQMLSRPAYRFVLLLTELLSIHLPAVLVDRRHFRPDRHSGNRIMSIGTMTGNSGCRLQCLLESHHRCIVKSKQLCLAVACPVLVGLCEIYIKDAMACQRPLFCFSGVVC